MQQLILSCDWGTSSFRLRLIDVDRILVVGELATGDGVAQVHKQWIALNRTEAIDRTTFFLSVLKERIADLVKTVSRQGEAIHVMISGMASSSLGIVDLPYAPIPFPLNGSEIKYEYIEPGQQFPFHTWIISGVSSGTDVMRGEETQLMGLAETLSDTDRKSFICLMPGTHSKHIKVSDNRIIAFDTYMTGELFYVLSQYSILRDFVSIQSAFNVLNASCGEAFDRGVAVSGTSSLLNALFSTRVNHLFGKLEKAENAFYLSGMLIGSELRSLPGEKGSRIILISDEPLLMLYTRALKQLDLMADTVVVSAEVSVKAIVDAHVRIFKNVYGKVA